MTSFKKIIIITVLASLNSSCVTSGGIRECSGSVGLGAIGGALIGTLAGKTKEDKIKYGLAGAVVGGSLGGLACLLNQHDRNNIVTALNNGPGTYGTCMGQEGIKTRGFAVKPSQCPADTGALNVGVADVPSRNNKLCRLYNMEPTVANGGKTEQATACQGADGIWRDERSA